MRKETVALVLDAQYGDRLESLAAQMPLWIVSSEINTPAVERVWKSLPMASVTRFNASPALSKPEGFLSLLDNIELHHGPYSSDPPVRTVRVLGLPLSEALGVALAEHGYVSNAEPEGFHVELRPPTIEKQS